MSISSVVIVGAGQAGFQVAASLRQGGYTGALTLIGDEPGLPYQRPPLSKAYLLGKIKADNLAFRPATFLSEQNIQLLHTRAVEIDRQNQNVVLANGNSVDYDHLVLATGGHNRLLSIPGDDVEGVYGIKTLADADALSPRMSAASNVVVVGCGFIGLEFAAVAAALGKSVQLVDRGDRLMARAISHEMSALFLDAHQGWGVKFHFNQGVSRITHANGKVTGVVKENGEELPADLVVYGIGIIPNITLAAEAGLEIDNGIKVDANLLTNDPHISAIGDVACFPCIHNNGEHTRIESVPNAMDQARSVAARLLGKPSPFIATPWFWTDQGNLKLQIVGLSTGFDTTVTLGDPSSQQFSVLCFRKDHLVGVESCNRPSDHMAGKKLLSRPAELTISEARTPGFDLKAWEIAHRT
ncbi:NAD(P)/FAD-dependent oxidoreductase [Marinobacter sp.]|uniref:NAD(P)/FAD-dependent oxidoreductase n=1 Tax=Marinobacter sp. TaxID=50741 RepID=UPI003A9067AE